MERWKPKAVMLVSLLILQSLWSMPVSAENVGTLIGLNVLEQQVLGRKFSHESASDRLSRLEVMMQIPHEPEASDSSRLSRLYRLQEEVAREQSQKLAMEAYNHAIDEAAQGKVEAAIAGYRKAIAFNPDMIEAYNNLASLLVQRRQFAEAEQIHQAALQLQPDEPMLHRNLGILYEKTGRMPDAIRMYEKYLALIPKPDPSIQARVDHYRRYRRLADPMPDYVHAATQASHGRALIWAESHNPIRIYIYSVQVEETSIVPMIERSWQTWTEATDGRLRFMRTNDSRQANILIRLKAGPLVDPYEDIGHTEAQMPVSSWEQRHLDEVTITLNTGTPENIRQLPLETRQAQIYRMALHELGHALGIWGHSPDPDDLMFAHPLTSGLSQRDIRTIRQLYGLAGKK